MNAMVRHRMFGGGIGELGELPYVGITPTGSWPTINPFPSTPTTIPELNTRLGSPPVMTSTGTGHSTRDLIFGAINSGMQLVSNIFASRNPNQSATVSPETAALLAAAASKAEEEEDSSGFQVKFEDGGLRLGKTKISYTTMGIGLIAWYLIQSPGFSRRR